MRDRESRIFTSKQSSLLNLNLIVTSERTELYVATTAAALTDWNLEYSSSATTQTSRCTPTARSSPCSQSSRRAPSLGLLILPSGISTGSSRKAMRTIHQIKLRLSSLRYSLTRQQRIRELCRPWCQTRNQSAVCSGLDVRSGPELCKE